MIITVDIGNTNITFGVFDNADAARAYIRRNGAPVVVKETGAGLSGRTARRLIDMGAPQTAWSNELVPHGSRRNIGLYDTWLGLIIPYITFALPLGIYTMSAFFREIPWELEKAAKMDGATPFQAFRQVIAPLAMPGVFTTAILVFISCWNDFLFALSLTSTSAARTVPAAMSYFQGATTFEKPTGPIAAAAVVITIPIVIFVLLFAFVFGGAIPIPGADPTTAPDASIYRQYLMPGICDRRLDEEVRSAWAKQAAMTLAKAASEKLGCGVHEAQVAIHWDRAKPQRGRS